MKLLFLVGLADATLHAFTGMEPASALSDVYSVTLSQQQPPQSNSSSSVVGGGGGGLQVLAPMTYISHSDDAALQQIHAGIFCSLHGRWFCNRTVSWVDFGDDGGCAEGSTAARTTTAPVRVRVRLLRFPNMSFLPPVSGPAELWHLPRVLPSRAGVGVVQVNADGSEATFEIPPSTPEPAACRGPVLPRQLSLVWGARNPALAGRQEASGSFAHAL